MPFFAPITDPTHLPSEGAGYETTLIDIKGLDPKSPVGGRFTYASSEIAKDVAAFANALGGTILIGAHEDRKRGVLGKYCPLTDEEAKIATKTIDGAILTHCSPRPTHLTTRIKSGGGFVVAVNIFPFIGQLVGYADSNEDGRAFRFPCRVGAETSWIRPEQFAMYMIPLVRRTIVLLEGITPKNHANVAITVNGTLTYRSGFFMEVRADWNVAVFMAAKVSATEKSRKAVHIPLDQIKSVFRASDGGWVVYA
jgi:Putative DNA-binding domain